MLTCTLGEEGEVIPPDLRHLDAAPGDPLAAHRREELRGAMEVLGVTHQVLGEAGDRRAPAYRDSGMAGSPAPPTPGVGRGRPRGCRGRDGRRVVRRVRPDVVVTYDATGGYGHPDHVRTHQATCAAVASCADGAPCCTPCSPRCRGP